MGSFCIRLACVTLILSMAPGLAMAYIDPGSGAYMVQALFAVVGAALFYVRHPIRSIRAFANRFLGGRKDAIEPEGDATNDLELRRNSLDEPGEKEKSAA